LKSDIQLSAQGISMRNTLLRSEGATLRMDGSAQLVAWKILPDSPIHVVLKLDDADAERLARIFEPRLGVSGRLRTDFEISGSISRPAGQGTIALSRGSIANQAIDAAHASLALSGREVVFKEFDATRGSSEISGNGHYDLASHRFEVHVAGKNFDLAEV